MVRNLIVVMGAMGALGIGTSSRTGSASVPQQSAVLTNNLPTAAGGALDEADSGGTMESQILASSAIPTGGQISFRTKTRNGIRGLLPKPLKLRLWGKKSVDEGLDNVKRFLHITATALVLEVEGEQECLSIDRGPESAATARVTVVRREEAGITRGSPGYIMSISVDGLFGVYDLLSGPFLAVIRRSKLRYTNRELGVEYRQVSKVRLIPVLASPRALDEAEAREEARLLSLLALAFRSHQLYFSHAHDVTHTLQSLGVSASRARAPGPTLARSSSSAPDLQGSGTRSSWSPLSSSDSSRSSSPGGSIMIGSKMTTKKGTRKKKMLKEQKDQDLLHRGLRRGSSKAKSRRVFPPACSKRMMNTSAPPPDARFFWNLGVLGAFFELRDQMDCWGDGGGSEGGEEAKNGRGEEAGGELGAAGVAAVDWWLTPVMSGFLQVERGCRVGERGFDVLFVSRRSRLRQGTRFTRRGADGGGNVANFVETEQSLLYDDHSVTSHVQIRGSIPVLWSSPTNLRYRPKVKIDPDQEASLRALRRHAEDLIRRYATRGGRIVFVNLVDKKEEQGQLGEAFDAALEAVVNGDDREAVPADGDGGDKEGDTPTRGEAYDLAGTLRHVWFDFHHECRNMHWENLDKLLVIVDREFGEQGFYHADPDGEVLSLQDGVVRTNCMDCLDRTNVVQSLLARRSMLASAQTVQLRAVGVDVPEPKGGNSTALALTLDMLEMPAEELERRFRDVWGNNADEISILYAGTPALKGDFTRTGQRTKLGLLQDGTNSAIRYVVNNFQDHRRQEAVDLLLGLKRLPVDADGNISNASVKEPLDLDLWTARMAATAEAAAAAAAAAATAVALGNDKKEPDNYAAAGRPSMMAGSNHRAAGRSESAVDIAGRSSGGGSVGGYGCSAEGKTVSLPQGNERQPRRQISGNHVEGDMRCDHRGVEVAEAAVMAGGGDSADASVVERVTGAALAELRMAGPYSTMALATLLVMAVGGVDLLASGGGGGATRVTTLLLLAGLASLPIVLSLLEAR